MGTWKGKPLDSYSKEDLINIILVINKRYLDNMEEHSRQLKIITMFGKDYVERKE